MLQVELHNAIADPDLVAVIDAWLRLPEHVRTTILTLAQSTGSKT